MRSPLRANPSARFPSGSRGSSPATSSSTLVFVLQTYVLKLGTPIGRKVLKKTGGAPPLVRVKPKDLKRAATARVSRVVGVEDGMPVTEDGTRLECLERGLVHRVPALVSLARPAGAR